MISYKVYNQQAEPVGEVKLADKIFAVKANIALIHQAVVAQMANARQVLAHTKGRGEVRGGGRKPWRQKGTGRARHGSIRSPLWIGGGITFGPRKDRNFAKNINQKMKRKAILMALSDKVVNNRMVILDKLELNEYKTKTFDGVIKNLEAKVLDAGKSSRSVLIINQLSDDKVKYSSRNLSGVKLINLDNINLVDILKYKYLVLTAAAIKTMEAKLVK